MLTDAQVHTYADKKVANKPFLRRVQHSAYFHNLRSALSSPGSLASKTIGAALTAGRTALGFIPIPVVGSSISTVLSFAEQKGRDIHRSARKATAVANGGTDLANQVKWELKDLSVEGLDRFRWKISESGTAMKTAADGYGAAAMAAATAMKPCDPLSDLAVKMAQTRRRTKAMRKRITEIEECLTHAKEWCTQVEAAMTANTTAFNGHWAAQVAADTASPADAPLRHSNCGEFCYLKNLPVIADPTKLQENLASLAHHIGDLINYNNAFGSISYKGDDYGSS